MKRFPLLIDPYVPCTFAIEAEPEPGVASTAVKFQEWIELFRASVPVFQRHALTDRAVLAADRQQAAEAFGNKFLKELEVLEQSMYQGAIKHTDCIWLCDIREKCLSEFGFKDVFKVVKEKENDQALNFLPNVLSEIDSCADNVSRWHLIIHGVFAGNLFDLGAANSAALFEKNGGSTFFASTRDKLLPRPWVVDDLASITERVCMDKEVNARGSCPYKKVMMLVDNAGSDVVLGMLPLAREFTKGGSQVIMAANLGPSCNDIISSELLDLLKRASCIDSVIERAVSCGQLRVICSGSCLPVIDLTKVSEGLVQECDGVDLLILEGMGRAIETNLHAKFRCDTWKLGMVKHWPVARCLGGRLYDCVCRYDVAPHVI